MALDPRLVAAQLARAGWREVSGVPCSILDPVQRAVEADLGLRYLPAGVEGEAVAVAAGAWLAGGGGAVLLQNSGLGNAVNPLASLALPYRIPLLLLISWRGRPGEVDAVHHRPMGRTTRGLLDLLEIPTEVLAPDAKLEPVLAAAIETGVRRRTPVALLVPRGSFGPCEREPGPREAAPATRAQAALPRFGDGPLASRAEVLGAFHERCAAGAVVATTGFTGRELAAHGLPPRHFPMQGSMGFAPAIALGLARQRPALPVFALDGDGAALMRLGGLATVGAAAPANLGHLVLDNGSYASTGGQPSASDAVDFAAVAAACGYRRVAHCAGRDGLADALDWLVADGGPDGLSDGGGRGPSFLHVAIDRRESLELPRPKLSPPDIAAGLRGWCLEPGRGT